MKKIIKRVIIPAIAIFIIMGGPAVHASDDEEPVFPNRINVGITLNSDDEEPVFPNRINVGITPNSDDEEPPCPTISSYQSNLN